MTAFDMPAGSSEASAFDVFCFSHLRWDFVFQRPQHLMNRFAKDGRVFFIEEPVPVDGEAPFLDVSERSEGVFVCVPHLPAGSGAPDEVVPELVGLLRQEKRSDKHIAWFYTPMMIGWSKELDPAAIVYDCMDELSHFKNAPAELREREQELFRRADLVFTGGQSLYEVKRHQHKAVYAFPSSIDTRHFSKALAIRSDVADQAEISHPRIGFVGVIDERCDIQLLDAIAAAKPEWSFVMVGPVVKISESDLPKRDNIHYLGQRAYDDLPGILSGWDVAMMPFAINDSTKYISPTKTPEYLAAGLPVVSTPITDVVRPYGEMGLVHIASGPEAFVKAIESALNEDDDSRLEAAAEFLKQNSWDKTYAMMKGLIGDVIRAGEKQEATAGGV